jgi:hypothetical protein
LTSPQLPAPIDPKDDRTAAIICFGACVVVWAWAYFAHLAFTS